MADADAALKQNIARFLGESGLSVEEIPKAQQPTPDLLVAYGKSDSLLIEIKTKEDNPAEIQGLASRLKSGQVVGRSKPTDYWNTLSGIIEDAVDQMQAHDPARASHHLLWFHCTGIDAPVAEVRMEATLYGTQKLFSTEVRGLITAYYFHRNAFHRFSESLDGVVISQEGGARLHPNPFSPRLGGLQASRLATIFRSPAIPAEEPGAKNPMICGGDAPRGDEQRMLAHLRQRHDLTHLQTMNMGFISGWIESPAQSNNT